MRTLQTLFIVSLCSAAAIAKANDTITTQPTNSAVITGNSFAIDLFTQVRSASSAETNICISPYSVTSALEMAAAGARGRTLAQMMSVLHWAGEPNQLPEAAAALNSQIAGPPITPEALARGDAQISIANALFGQRGLGYQPDFLDLVARQYGAPLQLADFAAQPAQASEQINRWAAEQTHDRIKNAVPASAITAQTRLVLVDAIYFKASWQSEFRKSATQDAPFFGGQRPELKVPMMQQKESLDYMGSDSLQALQLPYRGDFSLAILLPRQRDGLPALEKSLSAESLAATFKEMSRNSVQIYLPKFRMDGQFELNRSLEKMGMTDAFSSQSADFSGITSAMKLCIDRVMHKTFIAVDEAGTEAAAVTSVTMRPSAILSPRHEITPIFRADHPFLFLLRHRTTGAILFIGRVTDPK